MGPGAEEMARDMQKKLGSGVCGVLVDKEALEIGELYKRAKTSLIESVRAQMECGRLLIAKKENMGHGEWLPWLKANEGILGFDNPRTAQRLMQVANTASTPHLDESAAVAISRQTWGNNKFKGNYTGEIEWYTPSEYVEAASSPGIAASRCHWEDWSREIPSGISVSLPDDTDFLSPPPVWFTFSRSNSPALG